jgi:hypothetical protein
MRGHTTTRLDEGQYSCRVSSGMDAHVSMTRCNSATSDGTQGHFVPLVCSANAAHGSDSFPQVPAGKASASNSVTGSNPATIRCQALTSCDELCHRSAVVRGNDDHRSGGIAISRQAMPTSDARLQRMCSKQKTVACSSFSEQEQIAAIARMIATVSQLSRFNAAAGV